VTHGPIAQLAHGYIGAGISGLPGDDGNLEVDLVAPDADVALDGQRIPYLGRNRAVVHHGGPRDAARRDVDAAYGSSADR